MNKSICFEFDGVIHSFKTPFKELDDIPDKPTEGIEELLKKLKEDGWTIYISSVRCKDFMGSIAIWQWLTDYKLRQYVKRLFTFRSDSNDPRMLYVGFNCIGFHGSCKGLYDKIVNYE